MPAITVVQFPGLGGDATLSPPCGKVRMALDVKGLTYALETVNTPAQIKRHNPRGRVPALIVDGETIVDSVDVLDELERRFPDPPLEPEGARDRADARMLEQWCGEVLYFYGVYLRFCDPENFARLRARVFARLPIPLRWIVPVVARRTARARVRAQGTGLKGLDVAYRELGQCLDALSARLGEDDWLVGGRLTRADLAAVAILDQLALGALAPPLAAAVEARPALVALRARVHEHARNAADPDAAPSARAGEAREGAA